MMIHLKNLLRGPPMQFLSVYTLLLRVSLKKMTGYFSYIINNISLYKQPLISGIATKN